MKRFAPVLLACVIGLLNTVLLNTVAEAAPVTVTYAAAPGEDQELRGSVYGEGLWTDYTGLTGILESFSLFLVDPGAAGTSLLYRTGIAQITGGNEIRPDDLLFRSGWQTLNSTAAGDVHQIDTTVPVAVNFDPGAAFYLYIETILYDGPAWQLQTMGRYEPGGCCGGANGPGLGLRTSSNAWSDIDYGYSVYLNETEFDRDIAMTLHLDDGTPVSSGSRQSVPEPATIALMAMGLAGVGIARRRKTQNR